MSRNFRREFFSFENATLSFNHLFYRRRNQHLNLYFPLSDNPGSWNIRDYFDWRFGGDSPLRGRVAAAAMSL